MTSPARPPGTRAHTGSDAAADEDVRRPIAADRHIRGTGRAPAPAGLPSCVPARWVWLLLGLIVSQLLLSHLAAQAARETGQPGGRWEVLEGCRLAADRALDGDSFHVLHRGREYIFRLYYVDTPETDERLRERAEEQAAEFGIRAADIPRAGRMAGDFTRRALMGRPFTVVTRWHNAMGRSRLARFYAVVLVDRRNLAAELVRNGLARIHGLRARGPEAERTDPFLEQLRSLEREAQRRRVGVWDPVAFPRPTASGRTAPPRRDPAATTTTVPALIDINRATSAQLESLPGIGPKLAERIVAGRPYRTIDDLGKVSGIGPKTLERLRPLIRLAPDGR